MSSSERKIGHYAFEFKLLRKEKLFFDETILKDLLDSILAKDFSNRVMKNKTTNFAMTIESVDYITVNGNEIVKIIFKSCKFNHSPELMSSIDGSERDNDKEWFEGEKEKTHLLLHLNTHEATAILEERQVGVSIGTITKYLGYHLNAYFEFHKLKKDYKIIYSCYPSADFLTELGGLKRVKTAELHIYKRIMGSEVLNIMDKEDQALKDDIMLSLKAEKKMSLNKSNLHKIYTKIGNGDSDISRIRVYGIDKDGVEKKIDSNFIRKSDAIHVMTNEKGIVDSSSIFTKMSDLLVGKSE